jgi:hypothetical protein
LAREHNIDAVARQHEAGDAFDVIDADGDGLHPVPEHGGERGALARAGDLGSKHRLVRLDRREHDMTRGGELGDLAEGSGRERLGRPRHFAQRHGADLVAEAQRFCCNHDCSCR